MNEPKQRAKPRTRTRQAKQNEHATNIESGQLVVSSDANGSKRRANRSKGSGTARDKLDSVSGTQGTSDKNGIGVGSHINVAFAWRNGNYEGEARVVRVDPGGLHIAFLWNCGEKRIQIIHDEVMNQQEH